jgi:signal peptidase I
MKSIFCKAKTISNEAKGHFWKEFVKALVISLVLATAIRYFVIQPFKVQGLSMEPNFAPNDYLIVDELTMRFRDLKRGEVVVFRYGPSFYIKRIVGLPGEEVLIKDGKVYINGVLLDESQYLNTETPGNLRVTLADDEYFVMGDNRRASSDSRVWGSLNKSSIVGRAWLRLLPFKNLDKFDAPQYR